MTALRSVEESIEVPRGAGVEAFVRTVRTLLALPRVQEIAIDARGTVRCTRFVPAADEHVPTSIDFDPLMPYALVRAAPIVALPPPCSHAAVALLGMFDAVAHEGLSPIAWIVGASTALWRWLEACAGPRRAGEDLFGLAVHVDRQLEDDVVLLAAGFTRSANLTTVQKSFTLSIPEASLSWTNASSVG